MEIVTFCLFLLMFLLAGLAGRASGKTDEDHVGYHLADRNLPGWLGGLTSAATSHSAFMFTGMIGAVIFSFTFVWLLIGWIVGAAMAWLFVYPRLQSESHERNSKTLLGFMRSGVKGDSDRFFAFLSIVLLILLALYASAQIIAADATLNVGFGEYSSWIVIVSFAVVMIYSSLGGLRSTAYSDAVQGATVLFAAGAVLFALTQLYFSPDCSNEVSKFHESGYFDLLFGDGLQWTLLFIAGWIVGGFAEVGAPHVVVRVFSTRKGEIKKGALVYLAWFALLSFMVISIGVMTKATTGCLSSVDGSTSSTAVFGLLISELLPDWLAGIAFAGFIAATVSTADSLILAASAAVTEDTGWFKKAGRKAVTVIVGVTAFIFYSAVYQVNLGSEIDLYKYITLAWALIASVFVAPVLFSLYGQTLTSTGLWVSALSGSATTLGWVLLGYNDTICYELLPGVTASLIGLIIINKLRL